VSNGPTTPGAPAQCNPRSAPQLLAVTLQNVASQGLEDYQFPVSLNDSNFNFSRAALDGSDIEVWDSENEQPVAHWLESYDAASHRGLIWIKLLAIPPQQSRTLWLTSAIPATCGSQTGDGHLVFPFFSDVRDIGEWTIENQISLTDTVTSGPLEITGRRVIQADGTYNSTPGLVEAANGDWVLAYRKGPGHVNSPLVILRRSQDRGITWSPEVAYFDTSGPDPSLARTPGGDLWIEFVKQDPAGVSGAAYARSTDNGLGWSAFTFFDEPASDTSAVPTRILNDGTTMLAASYGPSKLSSGHAPFLWLSTDDGYTWVKRSTIGGPGEAGMSETAIEQVAPGTLLAISRADNGQNTYGHFSWDMGQTWGPMLDYTSQVGVLQLPQLLQVGSALILFGRENYFFTPQLVAYVSYDEGETFQYGTVLDRWPNNPIDGGYCWPILMTDGRVFVVYYADTLGQRFPDIKSLVLQAGPAQRIASDALHVGSRFDLARATRGLTLAATHYALEVGFRSHDTPGGSQFAVVLEDDAVQPPVPLVRWELPSESATPAGNSGFFTGGQFVPLAGNFVYDQPYRLRTLVDEAAGLQQSEILDRFGGVMNSTSPQPLAEGVPGHASTLAIGNNSPRRNTDTLLDFVFLRPMPTVEPQISVSRIR
jgi:Domain of unknown function (DUF2341)/BNR repeat-like domain